ACPYHKLIHVDALGYRVDSSCEQIENMIPKVWFALPPVMEWYYKRNHLDYAPLPPYRKDCVGSLQEPMDFIYPNEACKVCMTKDINWTFRPVVVRVALHKSDEMLSCYEGQ